MIRARMHNHKHDGEPVTGSFELHVFVEPLDPSPDAIAQFTAACQSATPPMKALLLALDYVGKGFVRVLQTSRYVTGDVATARAAVADDAATLQRAGLSVIREKVEAVAAKNDGVPQTRDDATRSPKTRYFEFHLLIDGIDRPLSEDDMRALRTIATDFTTQLGTPVPLSYNALKPAQRFLNLRARGVGLDDAMVPVRAVEAAVLARGDLQVKKVIAEYICFDSNRAVDNGWLEPEGAVHP